MKFKRLFAITAVLAVSAASLSYAGELTGFNDIDDNSAYAQAVKYCKDNDLMTGTSQSEFSPNENTSRAMLVSILYRNSGSPSVTGNTAFQDVQQGAWYYNAVNWAAGTGIVSGIDNAHFAPDDLLTKEQIISIIHRMAGSPQSNTEPAFSDNADISSYAYDAVKWACENNIIDNSGNFAPKGYVTRDEMANILYRYLNNSSADATENTQADVTQQTENSENSTEQVQTNNTEKVHIAVGINSSSSTDFEVVLNDSTAAQALLSQVPETPMMLPESYDEGGVCKYYDIPSKYIPDMNITTEKMTSVKTGEFILNAEGRLYLYYADSEISGEYMKIGEVKDATDLAEKLGNGSISFYVSQVPDV